MHKPGEGGGGGGGGGYKRKPWIAAGLEDQTTKSGFKVIHSAIMGYDGSEGGRGGRSLEDRVVQIVCLLLDKHCYVNGLDKVRQQCEVK